MKPETLVGPLIGALGTILAAWVGHRYRQQAGPSTEQDEPSAEHPQIWVPGSASVVAATAPRPRRRWLGLRRRTPKRSRATMPGASPGLFVVIWNLTKRLPPAQRRTRPAVAAAVGWLPFGQAAYFRTGADVLAGFVLVIPFAIAGSALPDTQAEEAGAKTPVWASAMLWTVLVLGALYAYLRSVSSNRAIELNRRARLESTEPPDSAGETRSAEERRRVLAGRLRALAGEGWKEASQSEFAATIVRRPHTDHRREAKLTALTLGLWGWRWIYLAFCRDEERDVDVDLWGSVHVAVPGSRDPHSASLS